ncbi:MAG TPA: hypothetical protein VI357_10425 [Mycobacteriales bacterium]
MPPRYEIRLCPRPGTCCADWFADLDVRTDGTTLFLRGELDQAALHGLLERVRYLRLDLLDLRRSRSAPRRPR